MSELTIEQRVAAAQGAGDGGRDAEPMGFDDRCAAYYRQNGHRRLTPRQVRRANKKLIGEQRAAVSS